MACGLDLLSEEVLVVAANSGQTAQLASRNHARLRTIWREIIWPGLIITCIGLASILFLISCARVSELELQTGNLRRQIDQEVSKQSQLSQQIAQLRSHRRLREFAERAGMVFEPEDTDLVQLPALPEQRGTVSALTPHVETIAKRPPSTGLRQSSDEHAMVAEAF